MTDDEPSVVEGTESKLASLLPDAELNFNTWDAFDNIELPTSWVRCAVSGTKCFAMMELSRHDKPRVSAVKEMRTMRLSNEVHALVLGKEFSCQLVASTQELAAYTTQFFESVFCQGVPPSSESVTIKIMKYGERNILNW